MDLCKESFCEDICNIARVLPNLAFSVIYEELNKLRDKPERVQIILKKYFASYEEHNCLTDDIKKIKRVVPNYPFVQINTDLLAVEGKENRVQFVLKNYFDGQSKAAKRALFMDEIDLTDESPSKKFKPINDTSEKIIIPDEKEQSSNETESYSIEILPVDDQLISEETNNVKKEITKTYIDEISLDNSCVIIVDKNSNESENNLSQNSDQTNTEPENIISILSNIFPQHSLTMLSTICKDLGVDIYGPSNNSTLDLIISVLFDQVKTEESKICEVTTCSVEPGENSSNSATQEYIDDKQDSNVCYVEECGQNCAIRKEDFGVGENLDYFRKREESHDTKIKKSDESNNTVQTGLINNEPALTNNIPSENIIEEVVSDINFDPNLIANTLFKTNIKENLSSVENIIDELSSTNLTSTRPAEPKASTSKFYSNLEYDTAINNLIQEFKNSVGSSMDDVLNPTLNLLATPSTSKVYDNPEPSTSNLDFYSGLNNLSLSIPSTSTNIPESFVSKFSTAESSISSSSENDSFNNKLENEHRNSNHILESNQNSLTNTNSNILDFDNAFFNNIILHNSDIMATNSGRRSISTVTKKPVLISQPNSIIKPGLLKQNKPSTITSKNISNVRSKSDLSGTRTPRTTIVKSALLKPKTYTPVQNNMAQIAGNYKTAKAKTSTALKRTIAANPLNKKDLNPDNSTNKFPNVLEFEKKLPKIVITTEDLLTSNQIDLNQNIEKINKKYTNAEFAKKSSARKVTSGEIILKHLSARYKNLNCSTNLRSEIQISTNAEVNKKNCNITVENKIKQKVHESTVAIKRRSKSYPIIALHRTTSTLLTTKKENTISLQSIKTNPIVFISPRTKTNPQIICTRATLDRSTKTKLKHNKQPIRYSARINTTKSPKIIVNRIASTSSLLDLNKAIKPTKTSTKTLNSRKNNKVIIDEPIPSTSGLNKNIGPLKINSNTRAKPQVVDDQIPNTSGRNKIVKSSKSSTNILKSPTKLIGAKLDSNSNKLVKSSTRTKVALNATSKSTPKPNTLKLADRPGTSKLTVNPNSKFLAHDSTLKSTSNPSTSKFTANPSTSKSTVNPSTSKSIPKPRNLKPASFKNATAKASTIGGISSKRENFVQGSSNVFRIANDQNKNAIRVRTDLYDTYFNGPITPPSKLKLQLNTESNYNNDDIIFVSADPIPEPKLTLVNKITKSNNDSVITIIPKEEEKPIINEIIDQPSTSKSTVNHPFYFKLLEIFPDICPTYLKKVCAENTANDSMDAIITFLLNEDYKKRDRPVSPKCLLVFEEQQKILQDLFPNADPTYLQHHCERLMDQPEAFQQFVTSLVENKSYPTKADYLKKMTLSAQEKQYTTEFDVKKFLEVIPNPEEFFNDPKRQISYANFDDTTYAVTFLKNMFCTSAIKDITHIFRKTNFSVLRSADALESYQNLKCKRKPYPVTSCKNIPLLQEIAYVKHRKEISQYLEQQLLEKELIRKKAKESGLMKTCQCCYDDEIMPDEVTSCEAGTHIFCKDCVKRGCEVVIGDGKLDFPCLEVCNSKFSLQVLQAVLSPKVFSKMAQRKQMEEVKSAGIEDLEFCPFCDFATIPAPGDRLFRCLNGDCMKESCRLCKEPSHIPLRCDEVEKDNDVKMRTYIENKMTEALLRKCYKCGMKFIKESGCNKMTCSCGAMMCYVCNQPVKDYKHFNGQGGDKTHLCPLYSDTHKLHVDAIKQSAETAKREMGVDQNHSLKIDPTVDIDHHYRRLAALNPTIPNVDVIFPPNINMLP